MSAPESREQSPPASASSAADKPAKSKPRRSPRRRHLVIVESPAKAETIARFLGDDYVVDASYGHVRDLPSTAEERPDSIKGKPWAELGVNVEEDFAPVYIVPADKRAHVKRLQQILKGADKLLLATDEDREGESIGWHLIELLAPTVPVERIVFHEVTPEAIEQALRSPRQVDRNLVEAQESRRILDRLFGYSLSPVLWRKIQVGLSAGRVQSVAVRLLVDRERERARFRAATYWDAEATLEAAEGPLPATLKRLGQERLPTTRDFDPASGALTAAGVRLLDEAQVADLIEALRAAEPWNVTSVETSPHSQRPAPPFTTSTLQQEASRKLGFSARRTMQVAQSLYEGVDVGSEREGLITYMRTDSVTLAKPVLTELQDLIREQFGAAYAGGSRAYRTRTRNAQEAHEAIRPTHVRRSPDAIRSALSEDQLRLYELVWRRTLASQMTDAQLERTVVQIQVQLTGARAGDSPGLFEARGRRLVFAGYLRVAAVEPDDPEAEDESERLLPAVAAGESVRLAALEAKRHQTQPPPRFTEASLVRRLEEEGLGRPSTYAAILSTIQDRGYAFRQGSALVPSFLAYAVTELLERHFGDLVEPRFTAQMEEVLDAIARGESDSLSHLRAFYHGSDGEPGLAARIDTELPDIGFPMLDIGADPESGDPIAVRIGRFGPYLQRGEGGPGNTASVPPDLPPAELDTARARELLAVNAEAPRNLGHDPDTGLEVVLHRGRFGPYVQRGPSPPDGAKGAPRPQRASATPGANPDDVTLEDALLWLSLPRTLGTDPAGGETVTAASGRFGPYVQRGDESRSLTDSDDVYAISLERALELLAEPKSASFRRASRSRVLADLGSDPGSGKPIRILDGRYGPYASDGETNASLPRGTDPTQVTLERAAALIADKAAAPKRRRSSGSARKRAGGAKGGKKAAGPAKRSTAKRSTAKRSTAKRSTVKPPDD